MKVLITGAQFNNKGAQSLLFTVMNELRNKYGELEIYYVPLDNIRNYKNGEFKFHLVYDNNFFHDYIDFPIKNSKQILKLLLLRIEYFIKQKKNVKMLDEVINQMDIMIDIGGFQLSSKFSLAVNKRLLRYINKAKSYDIPIILMPQSFGPFDYPVSYANKLNDSIKNELNKVNLLFAREAQGKELLEKKYGIAGVHLSNDIVLQASDINLDNIFISKKKNEWIHLKSKGNVGIIPNKNILVHGDKNSTLMTYRKVVDLLLSCNKEVYIFRHSNDLDMCKMIYAFYQKDKRVHLIEDDMDCFEYSMFIKQFDFIIVSRFHAVVNAYKESIPSIIFGWAIKYRELAKTLGQEEYVFDITENNSIERILEKVDYLNSNYEKEKKLISYKMEKIQINTCFQKCWDLIDKVL